MQQLNIDVISNRNVGIVFHDDLNICEPHSHTFFELAYIISGNAIHTLNGKSDVVKSGEYVFIEPGSIHFFENSMSRTNSSMGMSLHMKANNYKLYIHTRVYLQQ